jgi:hypothetical protein
VCLPFCGTGDGTWGLEFYYLSHASGPQWFHCTGLFGLGTACVGSHLHWVQLRGKNDRPSLLVLTREHSARRSGKIMVRGDPQALDVCLKIPVMGEGCFQEGVDPAQGQVLPML